MDKSAHLNQERGHFYPCIFAEGKIISILAIRKIRTSFLYVYTCAHLFKKYLLIAYSV